MKIEHKLPRLDVGKPAEKLRDIYRMSCQLRSHHGSSDHRK